jgi:RNA polymerase sigma-70 factor (ECF subfamily)
MEDTPNHDSWKDWFTRHGPKLLLCARQWTCSLADAEDVVQDAFVRFWRNQRGLGGEPMALVLTSIRRAATDLARRDRRRAARDALGGHDMLPEQESYFAFAETRDDRRAQIEAVLRGLPAEQREVVVLKIWGELTFEQIAAKLEISPNTAASRYRYGLTAVRKQLTPFPSHAERL